MRLATPQQQHRDLAEQVPRAAGVLDGQGDAWQCPATIDVGMPEGPEHCGRGVHYDKRHESPNLEWRDDADAGIAFDRTHPGGMP